MKIRQKQSVVLYQHFSLVRSTQTEREQFYECIVAKSVDEVEISYQNRQKLSFYLKSVETNTEEEVEEEGEEKPEIVEEKVLSEESGLNERVMSQIATQLIPTMTAIDFQNMLLDITGCAIHKLKFTPKGST